MRNSGFSLLEISIVLLFTGAIASSIVVGKYLIRDAEIRGLISQVHGFLAAINTFKMQYDGFLPGDFPHATEYWQGTEDGNGNSVIDEAGWSPGNEGTRAWQHLVLAEILQGGFAGVGQQAIGVTIPQSRIDQGGFYFRARPQGLLHSGLNKPFIELGLCLDGGPQECHGGIVTPMEGHVIDRKMDDGFATTGNVFGYDGIGTPQTKCSGPWSSKVGSVDYDMGHKDDQSCRMDFWLF